MSDAGFFFNVDLITFGGHSVHLIYYAPKSCYTKKLELNYTTTTTTTITLTKTKDVDFDDSADNNNNNNNNKLIINNK